MTSIAPGAPPAGAPRTPAPPAPLRVALVGNPNTGKSTVFNALTGMRQKVGNFPGVTVERLEGNYRDEDGRLVTVLDLPGSYSLSPHAPDEAIALDVLLGRAEGVPPSDVIVVVVDAHNLDRNLFLTSQLLELGLPLVVALNQMDAAAGAGIRIDVPELIHELGVAVIPTVATRGEGIDALRRAIARAPGFPRPARQFALDAAAAANIAPLESALRDTGLAPAVASLEALRLLAHVNPEDPHRYGAAVEHALQRARAELAAHGVNAHALEAERRYHWITGVMQRTVQRPPPGGRSMSDRVDRVLLHRVGGPLIFLALMAVVFQSIFTWAQPLMTRVGAFFDWLGVTVGAYLPAGDLRSLVQDGIIGGVGSVLTFLPQIAILFLCIGILEDSGYMARAAYLMDRYMRRVGLHGRSFIPLLSGYACAVPAIMSTRSIEEPKDRIATIMVVPLMSCSARLPVYTLLIAAFVPGLTLYGLFDLRGVTLLVMYLLGTVTAFLVAWVFRRTLLRGPTRPLIIEMPPYRLPRIRPLAMSVWQRAMLFVRRAGTIILSLSVVLWALATYPHTHSAPGTPAAAAQEAQLSNSALGHVGHAIEPAVRPLGYDWKIGVSIAASFAAREVFVSTMSTIYGVGDADTAGTRALRDRLRDERDPATGAPAYTPLIAVGLMVFYVFAMMCMSTMAVTVRESGGGRTGWKWAAVQFGYMLVIAYGAAWLVYHGGRALGYGG